LWVKAGGAVHNASTGHEDFRPHINQAAPAFFFWFGSAGYPDIQAASGVNAAKACPVSWRSAASASLKLTMNIRWPEILVRVVLTCGVEFPILSLRDFSHYIVAGIKDKRKQYFLCVTATPVDLE